MSQFTSGFWDLYIGLITVVSIIACAVLLWAQSVHKTSGSDTSGNALFGNLQVVAARQLNLSPVLMAATNSSGGVMGKMISPQNISTGVATTGLQGKEGVIFARTFKHSIVLTLLLSLIVYLQQFVFPEMIPIP